MCLKARSSLITIFKLKCRTKKMQKREAEPQLEAASVFSEFLTVENYLQRPGVQ